MKSDWSFDPPWMNAAGFLGFAPDPHGTTDWDQLGVFVTNPLSLEPRTPAHGERVIEFPGGFLLHSGHPNPGLTRTLRLYARGWARARRPVVAHLLAQEPEELRRMVQQLEGLENVAGLEIGLPPLVDPSLARRMVQASQGELPVMVRLPFERALELAQGIAQAAPETLFSLGAPRGCLPVPHGGLLHGRLYGPALFPQALEKVHALAQAGLQVVGAGGLYTRAQGEAMLSAGALAVQLDGVLWKGGL